MASAKQVGGHAMRVRRTGIALVHEGELILPAAGSRAQGEVVDSDSRSTVVYRFPVEVEVRSIGGSIDVDSIIDLTLSRLAHEIESNVV